MNTTLQDEALEQAQKLMNEAFDGSNPWEVSRRLIAAAILRAKAEEAYRAACVKCLYCAKGESYRDGIHYYPDGFTSIADCKSIAHRTREYELRAAADALEGR